MPAQFKLHGLSQVPMNERKLYLPARPFYPDSAQKWGSAVCCGRREHMFIGALQQDQRWGRLGPLPHLLGGRGALGDLSRHRLGVVRGRGPLYRVSRALPRASNFPQQTEDLCEGKEELAEQISYCRL